MPKKAEKLLSIVFIHALVSMIVDASFFVHNGRVFPWDLRVKETAYSLETFWRLLQCSDTVSHIKEIELIQQLFSLKTMYI